MNAVQVQQLPARKLHAAVIVRPSFAYTAQDVISWPSPVYGADCGGTGCPANYYYDPSEHHRSLSTLTYANTIQNNILPLFQLFEQSSYLYNLDLDLSQNQNIYGYNRLVYTFVDSFNNIITVPLDADIANLASVTATAQTTHQPGERERDERR